MDQAECDQRLDVARGLIFAHAGHHGDGLERAGAAPGAVVVAARDGDQGQFGASGEPDVAGVDQRAGLACLRLGA